MAYYYTYQFVPPDALYAKIKEELKSYFDTGAVDDLLFPVWTDKCLKKLGRSSYQIEAAVLNLCDFECRLPPDFKYVREAWMAVSLLPASHQKPGAFYQEITTCLNTDYVPDPNCYTNCNPEYVNLTYKTTSRETDYTITLKYLLQPGNVAAREHCSADSPNLRVRDSASDFFEVQGNRFRTNFRDGQVYLIYYAEESTDEGYQFIPDNYRIQEFIEAFIKQKIFEQLWNQITDETFNQIQAKYQTYKQLADEAFIMALTEIKKQTVYDKRKAILREQHSLDPYIYDIYGVPGRRYRDSLGSHRRRRFL